MQLSSAVYCQHLPSAPASPFPRYSGLNQVEHQVGLPSLPPHSQPAGHSLGISWEPGLQLFSKFHPGSCTLWRACVCNGRTPQQRPPGVQSVPHGPADPMVLISLLKSQMTRTLMPAHTAQPREGPPESATAKPLISSRNQNFTPCKEPLVERANTITVFLGICKTSKITHRLCPGTMCSSRQPFPPSKPSAVLDHD